MNEVELLPQNGWLPATVWDGSKQVDSREHWRAYVVDEGALDPALVVKISFCSSSYNSV